MSAPIAFIDLQAQRRRLGDRIDDAIARVLDHGKFIMGPEVATFESDMVAFSGAKHCISCANGTDAIEMVLLAQGIGPGQAVFVPSFTFASTGEMVAAVGATPVFVEVDPVSFNMDPESLVRAIDHARATDLCPAAVMPVDLFGQPADYDAIEAVAAREGLWVVCDAAQGFGASYKGRKVGTVGLATTTSFFPAKPLGCYGDGGAILTDDDDLAAKLKSIRVHGKGTDKYDNVIIGMNARLDTIQAAILIEKLAIFADELEARQKVADRYEAGLGNLVTTPRLADGVTSAWAQYTITLPSRAQRDRLAADLKAKGIPTAVYYPKPLHQQTAYQHFPADPAGLAVSEALSGTVLSLPMHPYLESSVQDFIIDSIREAPAAAA